MFELILAPHNVLKLSLTAHCWLYDSVHLTGDKRCPYRRNSWTVLTPWLEYKDAAEEKSHVILTWPQTEQAEP